jgi:hypothetical protein
VILLFNVASVNFRGRVPPRGGELGLSDVDEPLKEESSEYVEGTRMMKRMETTK